jgi:RNA polymerase sigma factor (sigma-70 family)
VVLRARPESDFESLYRRHVGDVYRYARAVLGNAADAEDVTQTTFLNAYRAIQRGERPKKPQNWLRVITHNICRQRFRQAARRPREVPFDEDIGEFVTDEPAPTLDDLTRALKQLPFNQRAALVMREFEGRSPHDIATVLGVSPSAVETLLFRARRNLREQLEGSLTCVEAERAISRQLDGHLARTERGALRAHLRECGECAQLARRLRAQRRALKSMAAVPLPSSLAGASQIGGSAIGTGIAGGAPVAGSIVAKLAVGTVATALVAGVGYEGVTHDNPSHSAPAGHGQVAGKRDAPTTVTAHQLAPSVPTGSGRAIPKPRAETSFAAARPHTRRVHATHRVSHGRTDSAREKAPQELPPKAPRRASHRHQQIVPGNTGPKAKKVGSHGQPTLPKVKPVPSRRQAGSD